MVAATIFAVLSIALFLTRFILLASEFRFGSVGATSLVISFLLVIAAFVVSDEPGGDRSGTLILKEQEPIQWHLSYLGLVVGALLLVALVWRAFA
jgi:hypothetical protein